MFGDLSRSRPAVSGQPGWPRDGQRTSTPEYPVPALCGGLHAFAGSGSSRRDNERRDGHLKSADFFDAEKFPDLSFKGTLSKQGGKYKLKGDLTMKGVTKPVEFEVTYGGTIDTGRGLKAGFKLSGEINRQDFGVSYGGKTPGGDAVIGDKVSVNVKVEVDKKA